MALIAPYTPASISTQTPITSAWGNKIEQELGTLNSTVNTADQSATANSLAQRDASGNLTANQFVGALSGNASTASKLQTAQPIALTGDISGSANFDGSNGATINALLTNSYAVAANGGQHIFVQSTQPTAMAIGDIWIKTQS